ncbi:MAG: alpha/beta hydrolase [Thermoflexales bacterium]|nr:alpha/beta hydrolase [Thermoflexales bacterium]MDW8352593.1 alpha/beta hydrolase [Anaerolineae bacterium]
MKAKRSEHLETTFGEPRYAVGADNVQIAYYVYGHGPEVMFWQHGFNSDAEHWEYMLPFFPPDEYRIIAPDLRGCANSDKPQDEGAYTFDHLTRDALAVIRTEGIQDFTLLGHSTGGAIAQWLASELGDAVKSLVLIGPVPATGVPVNEAARALFLRGADGDTRVEGRAQILRLGWYGDMPQEMLDALLPGALTWSKEAFVGVFNTWTRGVNFPERLSRITAPTIVIGGQHEPFLTKDFMMATVVGLIRHARYLTVPDCAHFIHIQQAAVTAGIVRGFVAAQASRN